ncbi:hypothetical protein HOLleu_18064 [Holothuria leucospilota]|uniref:Uncharacterized protein n=1 Tax=Holothuria leucospilota TaxID=206669 RepID=A0A9Q1C340_HOLLE|nr:hypothetical protein HOLleu_18064 [Holothuria leucospilota]
MDSQKGALWAHVTKFGRVCQSSRKWPVAFWAILKFLAVFYHRDLVPKRRCFSCRVGDFDKKESHLTVNNNFYPRVSSRKQVNLVSLVLAYESKSSPEIKNEEDLPLMLETPCEVCKTQWWNHSGESHKYTAKEIGGSAWNHRGSTTLSIFMNLCCIAVVVYDASYYMPKMWAKSDQTLHMLNKAAFFLFAIWYPAISLCSKIRSIMVDDAPYLSWTSTLNARYLVKRAQFHNLAEKGKNFITISYHSTLSSSRGYRYLQVTSARTQGYRCSHKRRGGRAWNHRGSVILSTFMNVCCIAAVIYDVSYYMPKMWANSDQILHMLNKASFFSFALSYPVLSLSSKIRSFMVEDAPYLSWTTIVNARYLVKRAQFHNLSEKGLPGKFFFSLCIILPIACALHRGWIYVYLSECPHNFKNDFHMITTTVIGLFFYVTIGCFIYIVYLIRTSFQRQFSLLLSYIKEEEGHKEKCLRALFSVTTDYTCFKNFCNICFLYCLPVSVLAITSNVAWQYMVSEVCSSHVDKRALVVEDNISLNVWLLVLMFLFLLTYATGGLSVEYIWDDFRFDLLQLQSEHHFEFWKHLTYQVSSLYKSKDTLTATLVFSLVSFFMALKLGDQDVAFLAGACNGSNITNHHCF